jgi:stage V sporulation protein B
LMISVGFAVIVYFVLVLKLKGITEAELRNFPKGNMLVRMAKKSKLL